MVESAGLRPVTSPIALDHHVGERPGLGDEHAGIRRLKLELEPDLAAGRLLGALLQQRLQRLQRVIVVEADVEARPRLAGNEVDGLVADIDRGEFEIRRLEAGAALVERLAPAARRSASPGRGSDCRRAPDRRHGPACRCTIRRAVERAAPADLDGVAELVRRCSARRGCSDRTSRPARPPIAAA